MRNQMPFRQYILTILFGLTALLLLGLALAPVPTHASENQEETEILLSSILPDSQVQFIQSAEDGVFSLDGDTTFKIKAYIEPVKVPRNTVFASKELAISKKDFVCRKPCTRKWEYNFSDQPISLSEFPHLQLVWTQSPLGATPQILVDAEIISEGGEDNSIHIKGYFNEKNELPLKPIKTINMKKGACVEMSYAYLVKRELGLKVDERWRYRQEGERTVLQSRVDLPLKEVQVAQVFLDPKSTFERIQFSVDANGNGRRDCFILSEQTRITQEIRNGLLVHTVDLRNALKDIDVDPEKAVLMEPILFLDVTPQTYLKKRPIRKIVFSSSSTGYAKKVISPTVYRSGRLYSLDFDLSQAVEVQSIWDGRLNRLDITIRLDGPQAFSWEKIRLFDALEEQIPLLAEQPGKAFRSWGKNIHPLGTFERIGSFRPLMWIWSKNKEQMSPLSLFTKEAYKDSDIEISGKKQWYRLDKLKHSIHLKGIFSGQNPFLRLHLKPRRKPMWLTFQGDNVQTIVETFLSKDVDIPIGFIVQDGQLLLPEGTEMTLLLGPDKIEKDTKKEQSFSFEEWDLLIRMQGREVFSITAYPQEDNKSIWFSSNTSISGRLMTNFSGIELLQGEMAIERNGKKNTAPVILGDGADLCIPIAGPGTKILGFNKVEDLFTKGNDRDYEVGFFDVTSENIETEFDFRDSEWWVKEAEIPLVSHDDAIKTDEQKGMAYLFSEKQGGKKWTFSLPDVEFIVPHSLIIPGRLSPYCLATLKINDQEIPIPKGSSEAPLLGVSSPLKNFALEIEYTGNQPLLELQIPKLKVIGLKRTPQDEFNKPVLTFDGEKLPFDLSGISNPEGEWLDLGPVSLDQGDHFVHIENSPYFRFKTLVLETESPLPWPADEHGQAAKSPFWKKLLSLAVKFLIVVAIFYGIYFFRANMRIRMESFWQPIRTIFAKIYWFLPDKAWAVIWFLGGAGLYALSLQHKTQGENYAATFGGLFMVLFFWHMSRLLKNWFFKRFSKLASHVYQGQGTPFFAWAIALLVLTAILVAVKLEPLAEQIAVIVYYLLVVGVISEVIALKRKKQKSRLE